MECRMNPNEKLQLPDHLIARGAKVQLRRTMACLLVAVLIGSAMAEAKVLAVPDVLQGTDYPCWIACASSVLTYYGKAIPMCYILDFVFNKTGKYCCGSPKSCFRGGSLFGSIPNTKDQLAHWCVKSGGGYYDAISLPLIKGEINAGKPIVISLDNLSGGPGHQIVIKGFEPTSDPNNNRLFLMDPMIGQVIWRYERMSTYRNLFSWGKTLASVEKDTHLAGWAAQNDAATPILYKNKRYWKVPVRLTETQYGCGEFQAYTVYFYDENLKFLSFDTKTQSDWVKGWYDCSDPSIELPRWSVFCTRRYVYIGGRRRGYVKYDFGIRCDDGTSTTASTGLIELPYNPYQPIPEPGVPPDTYCYDEP